MTAFRRRAGLEGHAQDIENIGVLLEGLYSGDKGIDRFLIITVVRIESGISLTEVHS